MGVVVMALLTYPPGLGREWFILAQSWRPWDVLQAQAWALDAVARGLEARLVIDGRVAARWF